MRPAAFLPSKLCHHPVAGRAAEPGHKTVARAASAFVVAMLLTSFFWLPTLSALKVTSRFQAASSLAANPANHHLMSYEWLLPIVTPNVLGTPVKGTYTPPRGSHPAVLNDYGEVASSYASLIALGAALAAPFVVRKKRPFAFAMLLMVFAFLTISEAPLWRDVLRAIPLVSVSILQRLRVFWDLGVCVAAALTFDAITSRLSSTRALRISLIAVVVFVIAIYLVHLGFQRRQLAGLASVLEWQTAPGRGGEWRFCGLLCAARKRSAHVAVSPDRI